MLKNDPSSGGAKWLDLPSYLAMGWKLTCLLGLALAFLCLGNSVTELDDAAETISELSTPVVSDSPRMASFNTPDSSAFPSDDKEEAPKAVKKATPKASPKAAPKKAAKKEEAKDTDIDSLLARSLMHSFQVQ